LFSGKALVARLRLDVRKDAMFVGWFFRHREATPFPTADRAGDPFNYWPEFPNISMPV